MADLNVIPANVRVKDGAVVRERIAGELVDPGMALYRKEADRKMYKAKAATAAEADAEGIAINYADVDDKVFICAPGDMDLGATLVKGQTYVVSATAVGGKIAPHSDLLLGDFPTRLGHAKSTALLAVKVEATGVAASANLC